MVERRKPRVVDPWVLDPSMNMEEIGMTGRSHTFDGVIRSSAENARPSWMDEYVERNASKRGMQPIENKEPRDFEFHRQIGDGAFSTVYLAREVKTHKEYAIKVVVKAHVAKNQKTKMIIREKNVMALLTYVHGSHPFVVSLYCTFQDNERLYFALSYCSRGDLLDTLKRVSSFDQATTKFYSAEIICALEFIHRCGIVHRDLKPENVLLKGDGHIQLTDFGSAKILADPNEEAQEEQARQLNVETAEDRGERRATFVGTAQYVSPEMLKDEPVGIECDYWALGAMIYQMLSGQPPFRAVNDYHLLKKITLLDFTFPPGFPPVGLDLVKKFLVLDPTQRLGHPNQPMARTHEFYEGIDFDTLHEQTPPEIHPYVPASFGEPEFYSDMVVEPGFDKDALARLTMGHLTESVFEEDPDKTTPLELLFGRDVKLYEVASVATPTSAPPGHEKPDTQEERIARIRAARMEKQVAESEWHKFVEDNLILRTGFVDKKKGLFARRRMFLLTEGPHIYYVDPVNMVYKGQIPLCFETKTEAKNFRTFFVHTPNRTYYLFDPARRAPEWCSAIDKIRDRYFHEPTPKNEDDDIIEITKLFGIIPFLTIRTTRAARLEKERRKREIQERKERTEKAKIERRIREKEEKKER
ncbi:hypothetical protein PFISCL1PPCAC_27317, partial [Pristionchus fissidentatus]